MLEFVLLLVSFLASPQSRQSQPPRNPHNQPSCGRIFYRGHWINVDCNQQGPLVP